MNRKAQLHQIALGNVILQNIGSEQDAEAALKFCREFSVEAKKLGFTASEIAELAPVIAEAQEWKDGYAEWERIYAAQRDRVMKPRASTAKWATCFTAKPSRYRTA